MTQGICYLIFDDPDQPPYGWQTQVVTFEGRAIGAHAMPCSDTRHHQFDPTCWCKPFETDPTVWIHNSADQREKYETNARSLN